MTSTKTPHYNNTNWTQFYETKIKITPFATHCETKDLEFFILMLYTEKTYSNRSGCRISIRTSAEGASFLR